MNLILLFFLLKFSLAYWSNSTSFSVFSASATCKYVNIKSGNTALTACGHGVTESQLKLYNPNIDLNNLQIGQVICCSSGSFPNLAPSKQSNGTCATYVVKADETCSSISLKYPPLTISNIESHNKGNYGWTGCSKLQKDYKLCLSDGSFPRPTPNLKAECGPFAPGDLFNSSCPLNACCSKWGFCGLTSEFCENGCYSNCSYGSLGSGNGNLKLAYWMNSKGKMAYNPSLANGKYDIIHYAFVNINSDFSIDHGEIYTSGFLEITPKKVASFGGWDFSTNPSTYNVFREGVKPANREKFATNIANFAFTLNLDGIDLDWEYPGAPDIPGIPADSKNSGNNYLEFVKLLKSKLRNKTLSMAIPSSYWYLKNYPIKELLFYLDYLVYMTYDIYGVWDMDKDNSIKCHVNKTAITDSMKMLSKAGVDISRVYGGIANYGRSYKALSSSCLKQNCPFSGPGNSRPMTNTPGVLADSEINDIKSKDNVWDDNISDCTFMRYDGDSIVSWSRNRNDIANYIGSHGFKGTALWALNYFEHSDYSGGDDGSYEFESLPDGYWEKIYDDEADYYGFPDYNAKLDAKSDEYSKCDKDPSSIDIDTETDEICLFLGMTYQLINIGQTAIDTLSTIDRDKYARDHITYVDLMQKSLFETFANWIGTNFWTDAIDDVEGYGDGEQYYLCKGKVIDNEAYPHNPCVVTHDACVGKSCELPSYSLLSARVTNMLLNPSKRVDAAKSFSNFSGLSVTEDDFVVFTNRNSYTTKKGSKIEFKNCEFVNYTEILPNPLIDINSEYLKNMLIIINKVKKEYKDYPVEGYYSLTPLAVLADVKDSVIDITKSIKKYKKQKRAQRILSILGFVFMGISVIAMPFSIGINVAIDVTTSIVTLITEWKLTGKLDGSSLAFGLIGIITPLIDVASSSLSLSKIFKFINLEDVSKLNGKFKSNSKFEDIITNKIKSKIC